MTVAKLQELRAASIGAMDASNLVDIQTVVFDSELAAKKKLEDLTRQIENPYCFSVGQTAVKVSFSNPGKSFRSAVLSYFISLKP